MIHLRARSTWINIALWSLPLCFLALLYFYH